MKYLKNYLIQFAGLKQGVHHFEFEIDKKFFQCFENSEVKEGQLTVKVDLEKQSTVLVFNMECEGVVNVMCDRCTDYFDLEIVGEERFIVKLGNEDGNNTEDVVFLPVTEHEINIAQFIYEMILLSIPLQRVHPKGMCNKEMEEQLKKLQTPEKKVKKEFDPRWDVLKQLKDNNKKKK